jgi:hypothetical protein
LAKLARKKRNGNVESLYQKRNHSGLPGAFVAFDTGIQTKSPQTLRLRAFDFF